MTRKKYYNFYLSNYYPIFEFNNKPIKKDIFKIYSYMISVEYELLTNEEFKERKHIKDLFLEDF